MSTCALGCYSRVKSITMCKNVSCYSYLLLCQRSVPPTGSAASAEAKLSALHNTRSELISCTVKDCNTSGYIDATVSVDRFLFVITVIYFIVLFDYCFYSGNFCFVRVRHNKSNKRNKSQ